MKPNNLYKVITGFLFPAVLFVFSQAFFAQTKVPTTLDTSKMAYNQISQTLGLYVYPSKGQSQDKQKADEIECYNWAKDQSGIDPLNLPKTTAAPAEQGRTGGAVSGAAKGAVVGTAIGSVSGDAGQGAAVGAIAGGAAGRRAGKKEQAAQNEKAKSEAAAADQKVKDSFTKAFSVCIEGKGYTIK